MFNFFKNIKGEDYSHGVYVFDNEIKLTQFRKTLYSLKKDGLLEKYEPFPVPEEIVGEEKSAIIEYFENAYHLRALYLDVMKNEDELPVNLQATQNLFDLKYVFFEQQIRHLMQSYVQGRMYRHDGNTDITVTGYGKPGGRDIMYSMLDNHYINIIESPLLGEYLDYGTEEEREEGRPGEIVENYAMQDGDEDLVTAFNENLDYLLEICHPYIEAAIYNKIILNLLGLLGFIYGIYIFVSLFIILIKLGIAMILFIINRLTSLIYTIMENIGYVLIKMTKFDRNFIRLSYFTNWEYLSNMRPIGKSLLNEAKRAVKIQQKKAKKIPDLDLEMGLIKDDIDNSKRNIRESILKTKIVNKDIILTKVPKNDEIIKDVLSPYYYYTNFIRKKEKVDDIYDELSVAEYYNNVKRVKKLENVPEGLHLNGFYYDYYNYKNRNNYKGAFRYDYSTDIISSMSEISNRRMMPIEKNGNKDGERSRYNFFDLPSGVLKEEKEKTNIYSTFKLLEAQKIKIIRFSILFPANRLIDIVYGYVMLFVTGFCGNTGHAAAFYSMFGSLIINWKVLEIVGHKRKRERKEERERIKNLNNKQAKIDEASEMEANILKQKRFELNILRGLINNYYLNFYNSIKSYILDKKDDSLDEDALENIEKNRSYGNSKLNRGKRSAIIRYDLQFLKYKRFYEEWNMKTFFIIMIYFIKFSIYIISFIVGGVYIITSKSWLNFIMNKVQKHEAFLFKDLDGIEGIIKFNENIIRPLKFIFLLIIEGFKEVYFNISGLISLDKNLKYIIKVLKRNNYKEDFIRFKQLFYLNENFEEFCRVLYLHYSAGVNKVSPYVQKKFDYVFIYYKRAKITMIDDAVEEAKFQRKQTIFLKFQLYIKNWNEKFQEMLARSIGIIRRPVPEGIYRAEEDLLGIVRKNVKSSILKKQEIVRPLEYTDSFYLEKYETRITGFERLVGGIRDGGPIGNRIADFLTDFMVDILGLYYASIDILVPLVLPLKTVIILMVFTPFLILIILIIFIIVINKKVMGEVKNDVHINKNRNLVMKFILNKHFRDKNRLKTEGIGGTINSNLYTSNEEKKTILFYKKYGDKFKLKIVKKSK